MSTPFRPEAGAYVSSGVLAELARLWDRAVHHVPGGGRPVTQDRLAVQARVPKTTVNSWATGRSLPRDVDQLTGVGAVLAAWAGEEPASQRTWSRLLAADRHARADAGASRAEARGVGRWLSQERDPFALEVHRPVTTEDSDDPLPPPPLPAYVRRAHDDRLAEVVARAAAGDSAMAVLVAGSSAGKTRALWEALEPLRAAGGWRLWHPYDPTRQHAAAAGLDQVGPRTVVWLNETQQYLGGAGALSGQRVAAKLRALLTDRARGPVLVLGTLWPEHHAALTRAPGSLVGQVLDGTVADCTVIELPESFAGADLAAAAQTAGTDARLAAAVEHAQDGHLTQYLAGAPELVARYAAAPPAARAVISAAMDARRLGHRDALPLRLLEAAAPAYLTRTQWDQLGEDWLEQALAYTSLPCKGARGPVTRIRPAPHTTRPAGDRTGDRAARHGAGEGDLDTGPVYGLADYLQQHGARHRAEQIPPLGFWAAAAVHARPDDLAALAGAAWERGLYRDAAQLWKNATAQGDCAAACSLVENLSRLYPTDPRPVRHAARHAPLNDPRGIASLLETLQQVGANGQLALLLARGPAAHAALDDPFDLTGLLETLHRVGADGQLAVLLAREPAAHAALDDPGAVAWLLEALREAGADDQVAALVARDPATHGILDDQLGGISRLRQELQEVGAHEQVAALLARDPTTYTLYDPFLNEESEFEVRRARAAEQVAALLADHSPAARVPLHATDVLTALLIEFQKAEADDQVAALLARDPAAHAVLDDPHDVARLLEKLREVGADDQVAALADRAARIPVDDPFSFVWLLEALHEIGADQQFTALADRAAAHSPLHIPYCVNNLLKTFQDTNADEQMAALLARNPANQIDVGRWRDFGLEQLIDTLREIGANDQMNVLVERLPAIGAFLKYRHLVGWDQFPFGREPDTTPTAPWTWDDLD